MKRNVDWDKEEESEIKYYFDKDTDEEDPRIEDVTISFWADAQCGHFQRYIVMDTPGATLPLKRILTFTNISELVECVLLPYKDDVAKPRALKTFYVIKAGGSISV